MKLIIIDGPTATGKTFLARRLARDLHVPAFLKDDYKERTYNSIQSPLTLKKSYMIENDSWRAVFGAAEEAIRRDESIIIEGNFYPSHRRPIRKLLRPHVVIVEIYCHSRGLTVLKRYIKRNRSGERHRGHKDHLWYVLVALEAPFIWLEQYTRPLRLSQYLMRVNTEDFSRIDYAAIREFIDKSV